MSAYYNEFDPHAAAWLRELISAGEIAPGQVDERSITEVRAADIVGFTQWHFFAGIGGWSRALRLAGVPDDSRDCTASLPCQPFSHAGKQEGAGDDRHLWPVFFELAKECRFKRILGEQVARAIGFNWLDGISANLEEENYTVGSIVLGAHSVGAPHRRQRLYWVANAANSDGRSGERGEEAGTRKNGERWRRPTSGGDAGSLADGGQPRLEGHARNGDHGDEPVRERADAAGSVAASGGAGVDRGGEPDRTGSQPGRQATEATRHGDSAESAGGAGGVEHATHTKGTRLGAQREHLPRQPTSWDEFEVIPSRDGKARRIERGTFPLVVTRRAQPSAQPMVDELSGIVVPGGDPRAPEAPSLEEVQATGEARVMRLKGFGNAILPTLAAEFILACEEALTT